MAFVPAKCPNCAANLEVNNNQDAAICSHCGTPFIVEKAIHNYQINNQISANIVNVYNVANNDFEIVGGVLVKYKGSSTSVVIPDNVYAIGQNAFSGCKYISSVTIPNSVTEIQKCAFFKCQNLKSIDLPKGLTYIGEEAFASSGIISIEVPSSVKYIGRGAFESCKNLQSVKTGASCIGWRAFYSDENLTYVELLNGVQTIELDAFSECKNLQSVKLPESLVVLNPRAFKNCCNIKIEWPTCFEKKQITKFETMLEALGYRIFNYSDFFKNDIKSGAVMPGSLSLIYRGIHKNELRFSSIRSTNDLISSQFSIEELLSYNSMHIKWPEPSRLSDDILKEIESNYKWLTGFVKRCGIKNDAVTKVAIPYYEEGFFGRKKQVGTLELIHMNLIEC